MRRGQESWGGQRQDGSTRGGNSQHGVPDRIGKPAPSELDARESQRLASEAASAIGKALGVSLPAIGLYRVPVATADKHVGTMALLDPNGETGDDRLMEAYASRAATAYLHALSHV